MQRNGKAKGRFAAYFAVFGNSWYQNSDMPNGPWWRVREFYVAQHVMLSFPPDACQVLPLDKEAVELERLAETEKV